MKIKIHKLKCKRCGYQWVPRKSEVRLCPGCKSPYWDRNRARRKSSQRIGSKKANEM